MHHLTKTRPTDKIHLVTRISTIVDSLVAEGISLSDALAGVHLSPQQLRSPATHVSLNQVIQCYRNAGDLSTDPYFAYHAGLRFHVSTFGMYGFAILSSPDFRQAARFAQQYNELAAADADIAFKEEGDLGRWVVNPVSLPSVNATVYRFIVELNFGLSISLHRDVMGSSFGPRELWVTYGSPNDRPPSANPFGCPALFGRSENAMVFDKNWLDGPATLGNAVTYLQLVELCDQLIKGLQLRSGLAGSVRETLLHNLAMPLSLAAVSRRLKMPIRTLKRKLQEEGTSYRKIFDELRTQIAIKYLRETKLTIEEIGASLGYSDAASFRYAFRRWTKQPPGKFRLETNS